MHMLHVFKHMLFFFINIFRSPLSPTPGWLKKEYNKYTIILIHNNRFKRLQLLSRALRIQQGANKLGTSVKKT